MVVNATEKMEITISDLVEGYFYEFKVLERIVPVLKNPGANDTLINYFIIMSYSYDNTVDA